MIYRIDVYPIMESITDTLTSMYNVIYDFGELVNITLSYFPQPPILTIPVYEGHERDEEMLESCKNAIVAFLYPMLFKLEIQQVVNTTLVGRYLYVDTGG